MTKTGFARTLGELPPVVLSQLREAEHLYDSARWFEVEVAAGTKPVLLWVLGERSRVGYCLLYVASESDPQWPYARPDLLLQHIGATTLPAAPLLPSVLVGGRRPGHATWVVPAGGDGRRVSELLGANLADFARRAGVRSLAMPFADPIQTESFAGAMRPIAATMSFPAGRNWYLELPGDSVEKWLASLDRKMRANEKASLRKFGAIDFAVRGLEPADVEWVVDLELGHYERHGNDYGRQPARQLHEAYLEILGADAWLGTAHAHNEAVGFVSIVRDGSTAFVRQAGMKAGWENSGVYFPLVYRAIIGWAYDHGVQRLDYSITADDVKRRRGCQPAERKSLVTLLGPNRLTLRKGSLPVVV